MSRWHIESLPDGDPGTIRTLERMRDLVRYGVAHPLVRQAGEQLARREAPRDALGLIRATRRYLSEHVHFVADPLDVEMLRTPGDMVAEVDRRYFTTGDCDDVAVLGATLLGSVGVAARFVVLGFYFRDAPMGHVYTEGFDGAAWRELDTTRTIPEIQRQQAIAREWIFPIWE